MSVTKQKKLLVIGSKGFIGSNLAAFMKKQGHQVWGADVVFDYVNSDNYFLVDASNADFSSIFQQQPFDLCVNCSGAASVPDSLSNPYRDFSLNSLNVYKLLESIRRHQPECQFINISSAAVYGNPEQLPIGEDHPLAPVSPYGIHKAMSEQICTLFFQYFQIPAISLRVFSAYGDGLKKQLFWDLYQKQKAGKEVRLFGTGEESRDFIYIEDLVRAIDMVFQKAQFNGDVINLANGKEIYIKDAVSEFYQNFGNPPKVVFGGQNRSGDPVNWVADITKLKQLGYESRFDLKYGLEKYYQWVKQND